MHAVKSRFVVATGFPLAFSQLTVKPSYPCQYLCCLITVRQTVNCSMRCPRKQFGKRNQTKMFPENGRGRHADYSY
ncbi:Uncharacterized protein APZ42_024791 [Daphnia magna]|uniref:Uncharacterized protein n=1 Tax=Daphnia magna TaxID=35525 RepID=A0A164TRH3_9CRUS|nr:Uncharacterized protein APZ42_024791 [Daphnia magna]